MIPNILQEIVEHLQNEDFTLNTGEDARMDSAKSESKIVFTLQNKVQDQWRVITPNTQNNRHWYDFVCIDKNTQKKFYCDIKISECKSPILKVFFGNNDKTEPSYASVSET